MKQIIINDHLDEADVHPPGLYQRLIEISVDSAVNLLDQPEKFSEISCPACTTTEYTKAFEKHGYSYWLCNSCSTLFVSPRPSASLIDWYLLDSPAAAFRDSIDYQQAMSQRLHEVVKYRTNWISELCVRMRSNSFAPIIDIETRLPDYPSELARQQNNPCIVAKPLVSLKSTKALEIAPNLTALAGRGAKLITAFDVLEHSVDLLQFARAANAALKLGGVLVLTTRSASGFDIQALWEHANVFPVEHINLVSVEGIESLLAKTGFEVIEMSTPGQLDIQLIERIWHEQVDVDLPHFLKYFLQHRDNYAKHKLQQFLQQNLLSSHLRVVARKQRDI